MALLSRTLCRLHTTNYTTWLQAEIIDHTPQPTALVNEACPRLTDQTPVDWMGKAHFGAVAATIMRPVQLDHARRKAAGKRHKRLQRVPHEKTLLPDLFSPPADMVMLNVFREQLAELNLRYVRIFDLRCFGGLHVKQKPPRCLMSQRPR